MSKGRWEITSRVTIEVREHEGTMLHSGSGEPFAPLKVSDCAMRILVDDERIGLELLHADQADLIVNALNEEFENQWKGEPMPLDIKDIQDTSPFPYTMATMEIPVTVQVVRQERDAIACKTMLEYAVVDKRGVEVTRIAVQLDDTVMDPSLTNDEMKLKIEREIRDAISAAIVKRLRV